MWGFASWAIVHLAVVGTAKALVFDGAILILALFGSVGQDAKKRRLMGERGTNGWRRPPSSRSGAGFPDPGAVALIGGTLLFFVATWAHPVPAGFWRWIG